MKYGVRVTFSDNRGSLILEVHESQTEAFRRVTMYEKHGSTDFVNDCCIDLHCTVTKYDVASIGQ